MPILLDGSSPHSPAFSGIGALAGPRPLASDENGLDIGLVNNMPDAALQATERQFIQLLTAAAGRRTVRVHLFCLPGVNRGESAAAHIAANYAAIDTLGRTTLDALIVTGCEPRAASLVDEPYWESLTRLVDWADRNTTSTLWSCLAAHAAVLHLDAIGRRPLAAKRSGVFGCTPVTAHALTAGCPDPIRVPHSRWNDLAETDLVAQGYTILTRSAEAGVDLFIRERRSLFVFAQGHPEYEADSIAREYRRDVARALRGERSDYPSLPHGYFSPACEAALRAMGDRFTAKTAPVGLRDLPRKLDLRPGLAETWQGSVLPVFSNWIGLLAERRR